VFGQGAQLKGLVLGEENDALAGVTVVLRSAKPFPDSVTQTNETGRFTFNGLSFGERYTLVFSNVGYADQVYSSFEIKKGEENSLLIRLKRKENPLNEVVVIGYGSQRRRDVTSAISSVKASAFNGQPVTSFTEAMVGQIPGVQISQVDGQPGRAVNVRIRGTGSITAGNNPLYVVDGFPLDVEAFSNINMNDIESIEILKDASATSIYGSRGANGVVMVSTRRGKSGAASVRFNTYYGIQQLSKKVDVLNPEEYVELAIEAIQNSWVDRGGNANDPNSARPALYQIAPYFQDPSKWVRTDWQDAIYRSALIADHNLSMTGGTDKMRYMASLNYFDQDGILLNTGFKRYAGRLNLDADLSSRIRFTLNFSPSYSMESTVLGSGRWTDGAVGSALALPGFFPVRNEDGTYPSYHGFGYNSSAVYNPVSLVEQARGKDKTLRLLANAGFSVKLIDGLSYKLNAGVDYYSLEKTFYKTTLLPAGINPGGSYGSAFNTSWAFENTFSYDKKLGDHDFGALLGQSAQAANTSTANLSANNYPNNLVPTLNAGQLNGGRTEESEWSLASYFFRLTYNFKQRYYLNAAIRTDGSSRFGSEKRWGQFPSVSAGWIVSDEKFLRNASFINQLKVRASYGLTGNNAISNYGSIGLLNKSNYVFGNTLTTGQYQQTFSNQALGWENSRMFDLGFDLSMLQNRIAITYDFYDKVNEDLLLDVPIPSITGTTSTLMNIGRVRNRGMELGITSQNIRGKGFNWTTALNISYNRNKVLELGPGGDPIIKTGMSTMDGTHITQVGSPIGSFYGFIFDGIYNSQAEINAAPHLSTDRPGDPIIRDVNGDKQITMDDRTIIGNNFPDYTFGVDNTFKYGNFDLRVLVHGVQGMEILNLTKHGIGIMHGRLNQLGEARDRWRSPEQPGNGEVFRASLDINGYRRLASTHYVEDASFVRLKNITLGYSLPRQWMSRMKISSARVYVSVQNLATWTKYPMYNPEASQNAYNDPLTPGSDMDVYPLAKTFSAGISLQF
jgi:TonB-linked SusC/RagA family outer membrane protein